MKRYSARIARQLLVGAWRAEQKAKQAPQFIRVRNRTFFVRFHAADSIAAKQEAAQ